MRARGALVSRLSGGADGIRAVEHAVKNVDGKPGFNLLRRPPMGTQSVADDALIPAHRLLRPGPRIVAGSSLPAHPALIGNDLNMAVALAGSGFSRGAENGRRPWRHDNRGPWGVFGHTIV